MTTDIGLIETQALLDELKRRYPAMLMACSTNIDRDYAVDILSYHGPLTYLIGLTDILHDDLMDKYWDESHLEEGNL